MLLMNAMDPSQDIVPIQTTGMAKKIQKNTL